MPTRISAAFGDHLVSLLFINMNPSDCKLLIFYSILVCLLFEITKIISWRANYQLVENLLASMLHIQQSPAFTQHYKQRIALA